MAAAQRIQLLGLASVMLGAELDKGGVHKGLFLFLEPYLQQTASGAYYLKDANQRQFLRVGLHPRARV